MVKKNTKNTSTKTKSPSLPSSQTTLLGGINEAVKLCLNDKQLEAFCNQLDKKPKFKPALHDLLTKPSLPKKPLYYWINYIYANNLIVGKKR